jgi:Ion channel
LLLCPKLSQGSGLTRKQRSLVIITIIFLIYLALGALITSLMMSLTFVNGLFFTVVTTLTIGFGDIVPITSSQRFVVCFYAVFGIIILGAGVRLTAEAIIEGLEVGYRIRLREYRKRRRERKAEREQIRRWQAAVEERLVERGLDVWTADKHTIGPSPALPNTRPTLTRRGTFGVQAKKYLNTEALPPEVLESAAQEAGVPAEKFIGRKFGRRARQQKHHHHGSQQQQGDESQPSGSGQVPLDFTWSLDDWTHVELQQQRASWISSIWERIRQALLLRAQQAPSEELTHQDVMNVLKRDERRSLYIKVRHRFIVIILTVTESLVSLE